MSGPLQKAHKYRAAGWMDVLSLPPKKKAPVPRGYTGRAAQTVDDQTLEQWIESNPDGNIGVHLPDGFIGLDIDNYDGKDGLGTFLSHVERFGPLPPTWKMSSRSDGISGIRIYRCPKGLRWPGEIGPNVEIVQAAHRYFVAWPSIHDKTGAQYSWFTPEGTRAIYIPRPEDMAELPQSWVDGITGGEAAGDALFGEGFAEWIADHGQGEMCDHMEELAGWEYQEGARHEAFLNITARVLYAAQDGHTGAEEALEQLHEQFDEVKAGEATPGEWVRYLNAPAGECHDADPCENPFAGLIDNPTIPLPAELAPKSTGAGLFLQPLSSIKRKRARWLWTLDDHPWVPEGMLTLIAGREGTGKSQMSAWLVAQVTRGALEGERKGRPASVIYYAREDSKESTIEPRFAAAGADMDRVYLISGRDGTGATRAMSFPQDTAEFLTLLDSLPDLGMVVFDPLISSMDTHRDVNNSQEIRATLEPVVNACLDRGVTVIGLAHWTKSRGADYNAMIQHSAGFAQLMRAGLSLMKFSDGTRMLVQNKSNLGPECEAAYAYDIQEAEVSDPEGGSFKTSRFVLGGDTGENKQHALSKWISDNAPRRDAKDSQKSGAVKWLVEYLREHGGSALQRDVIEAGREAGYQDNQLSNARVSSTEVTIHSRKASMKEGWRWELDGFEGLVDRAEMAG